MSILKEMLQGAAGQIATSSPAQNSKYMSDSYAWLKRQNEKLSEQNPDITPLQKWKGSIDNMMASQNPVLQQKAQDMMLQYHQRATEQPKNQGLSTAAKMAGEMGLQPGTPQYIKFIQDYATKTNQMYAPDYVTPAEAKSLSWIDSANKDPIVGQLWGDIRGKVKAFNTQQQTSEANRKKGLAIHQEVSDMLFGDNGIYGTHFKDKTGGIASKLGDAWTANSQYYLQNDIRFKNYTDYVEGTLSPLVKSLGEVGNLNDRDIERARSLIPSLSGYKIDRPEVAKEKLAKLQRLITLGDNNQLNSDTLNEVLGEASRVWKTGDGPKEGVFWGTE